ncbi:hypothetical protein GCM10027614_43840 [Micromonospora vulcania]
MRTPRVTVFTGSNRTRFIDECFQSLIAQTFTDWEWVVILNQGLVGGPRSTTIEFGSLSRTT